MTMIKHPVRKRILRRDITERFLRTKSFEHTVRNKSFIKTVRAFLKNDASTFINVGNGIDPDTFTTVLDTALTAVENAKIGFDLEINCYDCPDGRKLLLVTHNHHYTPINRTRFSFIHWFTPLNHRDYMITVDDDKKVKTGVVTWKPFVPKCLECR